MKNKIAILILFLVFGAKAQTITNIDTTTPDTNTITETGSISIPGVITNGSFTLTFTNVAHGQSSASAFTTLVNNETFVLYSITNAFRSLFVATNAVAGSNTFNIQYVNLGFGGVFSNGPYSIFAATNGQQPGSFWSYSSNGLERFDFWGSPTGAVIIGHAP